MSENVELIVRFHPVGGEDVFVSPKDFSGEDQALQTIAAAMNDQRSLLLTQAQYDGDAGVAGMVINLGNVVSVRVSSMATETTGPYL